METMDFMHLPGGTPDANRTLGNERAADRCRQLKAVARRGRKWLEQVSASDPVRGNLILMSAFAEELVKTGDQSPDAMTTIRALLCSNCRRLNAAGGKCSGQPLERCMLLNEINS
jgi:hypothetical protein